MMRKPKLDSHDHYWIRDILLYKIRIGYDVEAERFSSFTRDQVKILLDDDELYDFIYTPPTFGRGDIKKVVYRVIDWKPNKKLLKKAEKLVLDAIVIEKDDRSPRTEVFHES
jgi:hypothetical protein